MVEKIMSKNITPRMYSLFFIFYDLVIVNLAFCISYLLRFEGRIISEYIREYVSIFPYYTVLAVISFYLFGLYRRMWRYASIDELISICFSSLSATGILAFLLLYFPGNGFSRGVILINLLVLTTLLGFPRFVLRFIYLSIRKTSSDLAPRTLIAGAGDAGQLALKEMLCHQELGIPVGFLDDDRRKNGYQIGRTKVVGKLSKLEEIVEELKVERLVVALPSAPLTVRKNLVFQAKELGLDVKILPGVYDILGNNTDITTIRDVELADLLEREPVDINLDQACQYIRGKRVLVTGAGGSIGSEICRQVAHFNPDKLIMLGHGENSIFEAALSLKYEFPHLDLTEIIACVRDEKRIQQVFRAYQPQVVFHAAAHKHVPLMEENPSEAVKTNVFGTRNLAKAALDNKVEHFVFISTDKAVNPTSVMGVTKRIAEMVILHHQELAKQSVKNTRFMAVRFGNVLGSRGSVVPIFKEQIRRGGPVTVTHPDMTRYFMTIPEAVHLVLQAGSMGQGGEVFVLDMGTPVRILDMACNLIRLSGLEPYVDIPIKFSGIRNGEKMFEELLTAEEGTVATLNKRIYQAKVKIPDISEFISHILQLEKIIIGDEQSQRLFSVFKSIVPTYSPSYLQKSIQESAVGGE